MQSDVEHPALTPAASAVRAALDPVEGLHVVLGKGPVGATTAALLAASGRRVRVLSRSGAPSAARDAAPLPAGTPVGTAMSAEATAVSGSATIAAVSAHRAAASTAAVGVHTAGVRTAGVHVGVEHVAVDAADAAALRRATEGAAVLYNCANPSEYHRWAQQWPPMAAALLDAAEAHDAVLVTTSNLYAYGRVDGPITEDRPLRPTGDKGRIRADMWLEALARHEAGRVRVTEARAADFYGPGVTDGGFLGERAVPRVLAGRSVQVLGDPDQPHSFTYVPDVAAALVRLGSDERAWGRAWHVPTAPAPTTREAVEALCRAAGVAPVAVRALPWWLVRAAGVFVPQMAELGETRHQLDGPFELDSSAFSETFGGAATPLDVGAAATVDWFRSCRPDLSPS